MAPLRVVNFGALLFVILVSSKIERSTCQALKAKLSCLDCNDNHHHHYDFSGIMVLVKCDKVKKLSMATAREDGSFVVDLPSDSYSTKTTTTTTRPPMNCLAKLVGGPSVLYASKKNMVSKIVKADHNDLTGSSYTISTPLAFSTKCSTSSNVMMKCGGIGSFKTVNLPLPPEWGLAPSSYYVPFVPIIGVP